MGRERGRREKEKNVCESACVRVCGEGEEGEEEGREIYIPVPRYKKHHFFLNPVD